jgi:hypothetical protein
VRTIRSRDERGRRAGAGAEEATWQRRQIGPLS